MTDIVERLRDHLWVVDTYPSQTRAADMAGVVQSIRMAADEIEKLRAQVISLQAEVTHLSNSPE